jgi:DNA-binding MarR family transcriptional regulator
VQDLIVIDQTEQTGLVTGRSSVAVLAWLRLMRVFSKVNLASEHHLRKFGLNVAQFHVLARAGAAEGVTQQELADSLLVTKSNICQLLDRLERAGWIVRRAAGRTNRIYLTPDGRRLYERAVPAQERLIAARFAALSPDEQVQLFGLLRKVDRALG